MWWNDASGPLLQIRRASNLVLQSDSEAFKRLELWHSLFVRGCLDLVRIPRAQMCWFVAKCRWNTRLVAIAIAMHTVLLATVGCTQRNDSASEVGNAEPVRKVSGSSSTEGYVADAECAECHAELFESYQSLGMANSFYEPSVDNLIEDFENNHYYHAASDKHFEMVVRDGSIYQRRYQLDPSGKKVNELEVRVDAVLGSGNHIRSYLYRTPSGEMFQMPLAWYTQERKWRMNPGYDMANHQGFQRKIDHTCMFCHNAYPKVVAGADDFWEPPVFPEKLPHGIGCQRCHGPGKEHGEAARSFVASDPRIRASIVNPAQLSSELRDDVCNQCHLQPSTQIASEMLRFGRSHYSFRPGEPLRDYRALLDYENSAEEDRFEINHHAYRMRESKCFIESAGQLSCVTCHDPHRKLPEADRAAHYRTTCLECHQLEQCPTAVAEETVVLAGQPADHAPSVLSDCVGCHMPERRTQDVIHAKMTDHKIVAKPMSAAKRLAERREPDPAGPNVDISAYLEPDRGNVDTYVQIAASRAGNDGRLRELADYVRRNSITDIQPLAELANGMRERGDLQQEIAILQRLAQLYPDNVNANLELAMALAAAGQHEGALQYYRRAIRIGPPLAEAYVGVGMSMLQRNNIEQAVTNFREAVRLRPYYPEALLNLGIALFAQSNWAESKEMLLRALAADPSFVEAGGYLREIERIGK